MVSINWFQQIHLDHNGKQNDNKYIFKISDPRFLLYSEEFDSLNNLHNFKSPEYLLSYLLDQFPYFYKQVKEDGCYTLNDEVILLN